MSRLIKKPISIPKEVRIIEESEIVKVEGPKGSVTLPKPHYIRLSVEAGGVRIVQDEESIHGGTAHAGTTWSLVSNAVEGVTKGFEKILEIEGVGYRASMEGKTILLAVGFSHQVRIPIPDGINASVEKNVITISGVDKALVGKVAADIRAIKKPEPYLGKGIRYRGEVVYRKAGKKAATASAQ